MIFHQPANILSPTQDVAALFRCLPAYYSPDSSVDYLSHQITMIPATSDKPTHAEPQ